MNIDVTSFTNRRAVNRREIILMFKGDYE